MIRLREYRTKIFMSQEVLAEKVGIKNSTVSDYEAGRYTPSLKTAIKIADVLKISLDELVGRKSE